MAKILKGKDVAASITEKNQQVAERLKASGHTPALAVIRVGARPDDVYYEKSIKKNCEKVGIRCIATELPADVSQAELEAVVGRTSADPQVDGIFFFSPLPKTLDEKAARALIAVDKDIDSLTMGSAAKVFAGESDGFAPCTPTAVMEILRHNEIPLKGKNVVVIGRSMVVGKPLAMLLLGEHATVTICHSRTENLPQVAAAADILVAAVGRPKMVNAEYVSAGQVVIDVGINADPDNEGKMCGDVDYATVEPLVDMITPVPGGVGSVTTAVLMKHTLQAAIKNSGADIKY